MANYGFYVQKEVILPYEARAALYEWAALALNLEVESSLLYHAFDQCDEIKIGGCRFEVSYSGETDLGEAGTYTLTKFWVFPTASYDEPDDVMDAEILVSSNIFAITQAMMDSVYHNAISDILSDAYGHYLQAKQNLQS